MMLSPARLSLVLLVAASACGDSSRQDSGSATQGGSTSGPLPGTTSTGGTTSELPTTAAPTEGTGGATATSSDSTSGSSTGAGFCPIVCGPANTCCADGESCVADACAPSCASGVVCDGVCCDAGAVCVAGACSQPTGDCKESLDCEPGEFCEPTLEKCLPQFPADGLCEYVQSSEFKPALKWSWTSSAVQPSYVQAISAPLVVDLDDDGAERAGSRDRRGPRRALPRLVAQPRLVAPATVQPLHAQADHTIGCDVPATNLIWSGRRHWLLPCWPRKT